MYLSFLFASQTFKTQSDCIAVICGCNDSRHPSVFIIFFDDELDLVEQCWSEADVSCAEVEACLFVNMFSFSILFPPFYQNEFFKFIFPAGLTGYVAALFSGWL